MHTIQSFFYNSSTGELAILGFYLTLYLFLWIGFKRVVTCTPRTSEQKSDMNRYKALIWLLLRFMELPFMIILLSYIFKSFTVYFSG
jgi:hypothetical protein